LLTMQDSRRTFLKKAALMAGAAGLYNILPASIQKAMAIDAAPGSTYLDAEHVVFLMQENRSFDHCFGTLQGVRGFNDPRAIRLPNQNPVWLQSNAAGQTYAPFRLNLKDTKVTWMSSLPHSWENQVDALNGGTNDGWLDSKKSGNKAFAEMPLTMGYFQREDIPFHYALADAFTICDQHFCSALTGTSPNRLFYVSGTVREEQTENSKAHVWNGEIDHKDLNWTTFPERLEDLDISWKTYQNELSIPVGLEGEADDWLSNFTDNDLEFFKQFNVRLHGKHLAHMKNQSQQLKEEIARLSATVQQSPSEQGSKDLQMKQALLDKLTQDQLRWNQAHYDRLSARDKSIHQKAFVTNEGDPDYHKLSKMSYDDAGQKRDMDLPKGDILHQFRKDVDSGELPTVSWLVPPSRFSDHPGSPWYGAWYISEVMDILTKNQDVWKKTIFILTYDENDGYFDHIPPFLPPHTEKPETGKASKGLDTRVEHVSMKQEAERDIPAEYKRESAIGLGFRVPMLVISPWTKGGWVNSQVFDHTSNLQFLETFLSKKTGKKLEETQISDWRRSICGDLTSVFRASEAGQDAYPKSVQKESWLQDIHKAQFKPLPGDFRSLSGTEVAGLRDGLPANGLLPQQEKGIRPSLAIPYQLYVGGKYDAKTKSFQMKFESSTAVFGKSTAGVPFNLYLPGMTLDKGKQEGWKSMRSMYYALKAGDVLQDEIALDCFKDPHYHVQVYGPNGFMREFKGTSADPDLQLACDYQSLADNKLSGNLELKMSGVSTPIVLLVKDNAYGAAIQRISINQREQSLILDLAKSHGWYDFSIGIEGHDAFEQRFAGRVETGKHSFSDPVMGRS
jgi:phospholipase C